MVKAWSESINGVVASEQSLASSVGAYVLTQGGNAVDASIATSLALSVLIPHLGGVGGDFFMLYRSPDGRVHFINGSGQAPRKLSIEELASRGLSSIPLHSPLSMVVPGMIGGLYEAWRRLGSMEWRDLVKPAWLLASQGFPLPPSTARALKRMEECLKSDRGSRESLLKNLPMESGKPARMTGLASLLEGTMEDPLYMYRGDPAEAIEEYIASRGGVLTVDDMREYKPYEGSPISIDYNGWRIYEMPPNTQGITTLHILMLLEEVRLPGEPSSPERFEILRSTAERAYMIRDEYIGDPAYMEYDVNQLLKKDTLMDLTGKLKSIMKGGDGDTTFYAIADSEGGVVAGIQSLYYPFGSCVTEPRFQVTLNNRALGFTLQKGKPSTLRPGSRPLHTLSAVIMEKDERVIVLGASGGLLRPQQHALFITNITDYGMDPLESINYPRAVWDPSRNAIICEEPLCIDNWIRVERIGVANSIEAIGVVKRGYTDWRGDGLPVTALTVK